LPAAHHLQIVIFNMNGQQIRSLVNGEYAAGIHHVVWDAKTDEGSPAPSGIYYYRMTTEGFSEIRKLMLLK